MDSFISVLQWNKKFVEFPGITAGFDEFYITIPVSLYDADGYPENKKKLLINDSSVYETALYKTAELQNRARTAIINKIGEEISIQQRAPSHLYKSLIKKIIMEDCMVIFKVAGFGKGYPKVLVKIPNHYLKHPYFWFKEYIDSLRQ